MKKVHKALKLRHHKHTGKLLAHKHTSYRVLFLLMLMPIAMLLLVNQMEARATDLAVTATVPAPMPGGAPTITSPTDGTTIHSKDLTVSGTCPVIDPAIIVAMYDASALIGSVTCDSSGNYSLPVTLSYGTHSLVATVVTFTGQTGQSSSPVTVIYPAPPPTSPQKPASSPVASSPTPSATLNVNAPTPQPTVMTTEPIILISPKGHATWHGSFIGGLLPYSVFVNWGDGVTDKYKVIDHTAQTYPHDYKPGSQAFAIIIKVVDANGITTTHESAAVTAVPHQNSILATVAPQTPPFLAFVQQYMWQIYIITFSCLAFLWYLERGRLAFHPVHVIGKFFGKRQAHHR